MKKLHYLYIIPLFVFFQTGLVLAANNSLDNNSQPLAGPQISPASPLSPTSPVSLSGYNHGYEEVGGDFSSLSNNYKNWSGEYLRSAINTDPKNTWSLEIDNQSEFGNQGLFESVGNTHIWSPDWSTSISAGTSQGGRLFLPEYRVDAFIYKKWLDDKNLVTDIGIGYYDSKVDHQDELLTLGATYYFDSPWIVEGGLHFDVSDPGSEFAPMVFGAVTWGRNKEDFLTLRDTYGKEAYEILGVNNTAIGFYSNEVDVVWRHWFNRGPWGFNARGEYYSSTVYDRTGGTFGVFREF